jgi:hypothetical protein
MNAIAKDGVTRTPTWSGFLNTTAKLMGSPKKKIVQEVNALIDSKDFLTAAEVIRNDIGKDKFINQLKACFHTPDFQSAEIHDLIFKLDFRIYLTPNVDNIYETAVGKFGSGAVTVKIYDDGDIADALRRHERVLIKTHGSVSKPSRIIFTRTDYAEARNKHADFYELIDALIRTHTILFLGCGIDDPDIRSLLENYRYRHPQGQRHFFISEEGKLSDQVKNVIQESMKIEIIDYKKSKGHIALTEGLRSLVNLVETKRREIAASQTW